MLNLDAIRQRCEDMPYGYFEGNVRPCAHDDLLALLDAVDRVREKALKIQAAIDDPLQHSQYSNYENGLTYNNKVNNAKQAAWNALVDLIGKREVELLLHHMNPRPVLHNPPKGKPDA